MEEGSRPQRQPSLDPLGQEQVSRKIASKLCRVVAGHGETRDNAGRWRTRVNRLCLGTSDAVSNQLARSDGLSLDFTPNYLSICDSGTDRTMRYPLTGSSALLVAGGNGPGVNNNQFLSPASVSLSLCFLMEIVTIFFVSEEWLLVAVGPFSLSLSPTGLN